MITSHSCLLQILASKWFKYIYSNKNLKLAYSSVTKATTYSSAVTANYSKVITNTIAFWPRPTTRESVHSVICGNFRSCDKDGGHNIWCDIAENTHAMRNFTAVCVIELELMPAEILHCGNRDFWSFCSQWPLYMNLSHIQSRYNGGPKMNFWSQSFWKLSISYYRHAYATKIKYHAT